MSTPTNRSAGTVRLVLGILAALLLLRLVSLGLYPLRDTTEARYGEIARIMVELQDWITPWFDYEVPFWGKPPLSFWTTALSFQALGVNEFAARLPHWISGLLVLWLMWGLTVRRSPTLALYACTVLAGSALFFVSAGMVMTDMAMVVGTTMAMRGFWLGLHGEADQRSRERWLLFIGLGIGLLAKGPIAVVLSGMPIALWTLTQRALPRVWRELPWVRGTLLTLLIAGPWYLLAEAKTPGFIDYFIVGEHFNRFLVAGWTGDLYGTAHDYPRGTIWLFSLVDFMPWTLVLPLYFILRLLLRTQGPLHVPPAAQESEWRRYLWWWSLMPAVFFTFAGNILWPYVLPGFPALALLVGGWLDRDPSPRRVVAVLAVGSLITAALSTAYLVDLRRSGKTEDKAQKALVATYEAQRQPGEALLYLGRRQFSADFYSRGQVSFVADRAALQSKLGQGPLFVAVTTEELSTWSPDQTHGWKRVAVHGRYALFRIP